MNKILIVDDDLHLRKLVKTYADLENFICEEAENGSDALKKATGTGSFDLIVLDVMMPGMDGFETLAELRKVSQTPVILLTARSEEYDKLFGFNLGADDYVPKPFSPKELMARIHAILKRMGKQSKNSGFVYGDLRISEDSRTVQMKDATLVLTPKEFDLLLFFARNNHIVLSRERLLKGVWGYDYFGDARTVDTHVKSLRDRLGEYRAVIQTIWGVGYKFEYNEH